MKLLAAAPLAGMADLSWSMPRRAQPAGLQLFTVMKPLEQDFTGTIHRVAAMGYREVETIGSFGRDPKMVGELFDRAGLRSPSQHIAADGLYDVFRDLVFGRMTLAELEKSYRERQNVHRIERLLDQCIPVAKALGQHYLVWPVIWESDVASSASIDALVRGFNKAGAICGREGLGFVIHNHAAELVQRGDSTPYDIIIRNTDPENVKFELDFYWMTRAGRDPAAYLKTYPGRYKLCHLKDSGPDGEIVTVGTGTIDFPVLLDLAKGAGIDHFFVENDTASNPMEDAESSIKFLKPLFVDLDRPRR